MVSEFFSGSLDPRWPHALLLSVAIIASFAVAVGIVMESPHWSIANALVIGGVVLEAICTLLIFGFDEGISSAQQSKIIALESQLAPREIDGKVFMEMLVKEPKEKCEILYTPGDPDSYQLSLQIFWYIMHAGWDCDVERPIPPKADSRSFVAWPTGISLVSNTAENVKPGSAFATLLAAFRATLGQTGAGADDKVPLGTIRIVVAPKPPFSLNPVPPDAGLQPHQ
jgi:hypothetical protein